MNENEKPRDCNYCANHPICTIYAAMETLMTAKDNPVAKRFAFAIEDSGMDENVLLAAGCEFYLPQEATP